MLKFLTSSISLLLGNKIKISPILFSIDFCLNNNIYFFKLGNINGLFIDNTGFSCIFIYIFEIKYFLIFLNYIYSIFE